MKNKKLKKHTLLKGEGVNQHTLYGEFTLIEKESDFHSLSLSKDGVLQHESPNGEFAEHNTLQVEKGKWVMGKQVEYNPFTQSVNRVWD
jgi:hypothetical protein